MSAVCLFALLIGLVCSVALLRPGYASTTTKPAGLSLTKVTAVMPTTPKPTAAAPAVAVSPLLPETQPATETADEAVVQPVHTFDGRPLRLVKRMTMLTTA